MQSLLPDTQISGRAVRLIHVEGPINIGGKRNFGCEQAAGEVIIHWDDDDFSAPERIQDQVSRLLLSGKKVTGYSSMRFVEEDGSQWMYEGNSNYALGTSLCYFRSWWEKNPFPSVQVGEDNHFVQWASARGVLITAAANEMMFATNHPGNTSPRQKGTSWKKL